MLRTKPTRYACRRIWRVSKRNIRMWSFPTRKCWEIHLRANFIDLVSFHIKSEKVCWSIKARSVCKKIKKKTKRVKHSLKIRLSDLHELFFHFFTIYFHTDFFPKRWKSKHAQKTKLKKSSIQENELVLALNLVWGFCFYCASLNLFQTIKPIFRNSKYQLWFRTLEFQEVPHFLSLKSKCRTETEFQNG